MNALQTNDFDEGRKPMKACAFTGHRPEKLSFGTNEESPKCKALKQRLFCETLRMTRQGVTTFLTGMARGTDLWAAETVLQLREVFPKIQLWAIIPYAKQAASWNQADQARYHHLLSSMDKVVHVSVSYTRGCLQKRNRYLVDHADCLIAVFDGQAGGTKYTIDYARKMGRDVVIINPEKE